MVCLIGAGYAFARRNDPHWFNVFRVIVVTYMGVTGIVYNLLLRGVELPQGTTVEWSNEVLHVAACAYIVLDWFIAPGRSPLPWRTLRAIAIFPLVWVVYTMIRAPFTTGLNYGGKPFYPYPFLNPASRARGLVLGRVLHRADHRRRTGNRAPSSSSSRASGRARRPHDGTAGRVCDEMSRRDALDVVTALLGAALVAAALVLIFVARVEYGGVSVYVSELGATGVPTARMFEVALLMIVAGGSLVAFAGKDIRSRLRLLAIWTPSISIWVVLRLLSRRLPGDLQVPVPAADPVAVRLRRTSPTSRAR